MGATDGAAIFQRDRRARRRRLRARFVAQPDYDRLTTVVYDPPVRPAIVAVSMTSAYAALTGGYDLDVPDLSADCGLRPLMDARARRSSQLDGVARGRNVADRPERRSGERSDATHEPQAGYDDLAMTLGGERHDDPIVPVAATAALSECCSRSRVSSNCSIASARCSSAM